MVKTIFDVAATVAVISLFLDGEVMAFLTPSRRSTMTMQSSMLDNLPNIFGGNEPKELAPSAAMPSFPQPKADFQAAPEALVARAKSVLVSDFGVSDPSLLDEDFVWVGASLGSKVLGKDDFLAAGKFFDLRAAFPDLDYRAHDFRIDDKDQLTIRFTVRTTGTMRGELRLRNEVIPPNGVQMRCPPEAISMTFDEETGKLIKLCSGFAMDNLVGNTGGLCGVMGAATVAGSPPSDWEVYPATKVIKRFFGRPVQQVEEPISFLAPFPETVMIQLSKGILAADMAAFDPDLLSSSFSFSTPYEGPIGKKKYVESFAAKVLGEFEPELTHFRVDPYDPYRVWVDVRQPDGSPEAMSFTFDDDGFCTRITAWAVMDPSSGNAGGLGGINGVEYAKGNSPLGISSRPLPQIVGRIQKRIFQPITKVGVDEYFLKGNEEIEQSTTPATEDKPEKVDSPFFATSVPSLKIPSLSPESGSDVADRRAQSRAASVERKAKAEEAAKARIEKARQIAVERKKQAEDAAVARKARAEAAAVARKAKAAEAAKAQKLKTDEMVARRTSNAASSAKAQKEKAAAAAAVVRAAQAEKATAAAAARKAKAETRSAKAAEVAAAKKAKAEEAAKAKKAQAEATAAARKAKAEEAAQAKKAQAEAAAAAKKAKADEGQAKKAQAEAAAAAKKAKAEEAARAMKARADAVASAKSAKGKATEKKAKAGIFGMTKNLQITTQKVAPKGVPTLTRWRKNRDGSVTGFISGSKAFDDGEKVTTSEIAKGDYSKGTVVQTSSGSKYFLA